MMDDEEMKKDEQRTLFLKNPKQMRSEKKKMSLSLLPFIGAKIREDTRRVARLDRHRVIA